MGSKIKDGIPLSRGSLILKWRFGFVAKPCQQREKELLSILSLTGLSGTPQPKRIKG